MKKKRPPSNVKTIQSSSISPELKILLDLQGIKLMYSDDMETTHTDDMKWYDEICYEEHERQDLIDEGFIKE